MIVILDGMETISRLSQSLNAKLPILVTLDGIVMLSRLLQPPNVYHSTDHSGTGVPVFAYGQGAELFHEMVVENIQIAHTIAALMGEENFGDQSKYQSLTKSK